jgi:hypothetical protein
MRLNEKQKTELLSKIQELTGGPHKCSVCGSRSWVVSDRIFELREFQGGGIVLGGDASVIPVVAMACSQCGNTVLVNALALGLLTPEETNPRELQK